MDIRQIQNNISAHENEIRELEKSVHEHAIKLISKAIGLKLSDCLLYEFDLQWYPVPLETQISNFNLWDLPKGYQPEGCNTLKTINDDWYRIGNVHLQDNNETVTVFIDEVEYGTTSIEHPESYGVWWSFSFDIPVDIFNNPCEWKDWIENRSLEHKMIVSELNKNEDRKSYGGQ